MLGRVIQNCFRAKAGFAFSNAKSAAISLKKGQISQVIGAVVDVQFEG